MKLINQSKGKLLTSKGVFSVGKIIDLPEDEARTIAKYEGVSFVEDLEDKSPKEKPSKAKREDK